VQVQEKLKHLKHLVRLIVENEILPQDSYLAGGTALYFYFSHRVSIDLDFFTQKQFRSESLLFKIRETIKDTMTELIEKDTLIIYLSPEKIRFSLFSLPYKLLSPLTPYQLAPGRFINLASLEDIEAMKAIALVQRGSAKDFVDLYFLLKKTGHSFPELFAKAQEKYGLTKEYEYHLKKALVYFDDAERELEAIWLIKKEGQIKKISKADWQKIKNFFLQLCL